MQTSHTTCLKTASAVNTYLTINISLYRNDSYICVVRSTAYFHGANGVRVVSFRLCLLEKNKTRSQITAHVGRYVNRQVFIHFKMLLPTNQLQDRNSTLTPMCYSSNMLLSHHHIITMNEMRPHMRHGRSTKYR